MPWKPQRTVLFYLLVSTLACVFITVALGVIGHLSNPGNKWSETIYRVLMLAKLETPAPDELKPLGLVGSAAHGAGGNSSWLEVARIFAGLSLAQLAVWGGFKFWKEVWEFIGPLQLQRHTVVCGLTDIGCKLIAGCQGAGGTGKWIAIESDSAHPSLGFAQKRVLVKSGDPTDHKVLEEADIERASCVFAVTAKDEVNRHIAGLAADRMGAVKRKPGEKARIYVHQFQSNLALNDLAFKTYRRSDAKIIVFSEPRDVAAKLVKSPAFLQFAPYKKDEVAHYFLIGFGPQGREIALQLGHYGHFPNAKRARITIADRNIQATARDFLAEYGRFTAWNDTQLGVKSFSSATDDWSGKDAALSAPFLTPDAECPHAVDYVTNAMFKEPVSVSEDRFLAELAEQAAEPGVRPVLIVCPSDPRESFGTAVKLREGLRKYCPTEIPIFAWMPWDAASIADPTSGVYPFGRSEGTADVEDLLRSQREYFAAILHEAHQTLMQRKAELKKETFPKTAWEDLPSIFVESSRQAAEHLAIKLWMLGLELKHGGRISPDKMAFPKIGPQAHAILSAMEHNRWNAERLLSGWRYGVTKLVPERRHPMLVPTERLPREDLLIDMDQIRTALLEAQREDYYLQRFTEKPRVAIEV